MSIFWTFGSSRHRSFMFLFESGLLYFGGLFEYYMNKLSSYATLSRLAAHAIASFVFCLSFIAFLTRMSGHLGITYKRYTCFVHAIYLCLCICTMHSVISCFCGFRTIIGLFVFDCSGLTFGCFWQSTKNGFSRTFLAHTVQSNLAGCLTTWTSE